MHYVSKCVLLTVEITLYSLTVFCVKLFSCNACGLGGLGFPPAGYHDGF